MKIFDGVCGLVLLHVLENKLKMLRVLKMKIFLSKIFEIDCFLSHFRAHSWARRPLHDH